MLICHIVVVKKETVWSDIDATDGESMAESPSNEDSNDELSIPLNQLMWREVPLIWKPLLDHLKDTLIRQKIL